VLCGRTPTIPQITVIHKTLSKVGVENQLQKVPFEVVPTYSACVMRLCLNFSYLSSMMCPLLLCRMLGTGSKPVMSYVSFSTPEQAQSHNIFACKSVCSITVYMENCYFYSFAPFLSLSLCCLTEWICERNIGFQVLFCTFLSSKRHVLIKKVEQLVTVSAQFQLITIKLLPPFSITQTVNILML